MLDIVWYTGSTPKRGQHMADEHKHVRRYGLTPAEYRRMFAQQNGVCAVCGQPELGASRGGGGVRRLAVDHDHETGDVRALLCGACNVALGMLGEDPARIMSLALYIARFKK